MKVYSWQGHRRECPPAPNGNRQTREVCAAPSKAALARIVGVTYPRQLSNLDEAGNAEDRKLALASPGVVLWCPLDERPPTWRRDE